MRMHPDYRGRPHRLAATLAAMLAVTMTATAQTPSVEELWKIVQAQQQTIEALQARLAATEQKTDTTVAAVQDVDRKVASVDEKAEATAEAVEAAGSRPAGGAAAWAEHTRIGGYGELHYNNLDNDGAGGDRDRTDFHRFVMYLSHDFTDRLHFFSELELEHVLAADGEAGEMQLEQAWLQYDLNERHHLRAGLDVLPIGIINQTHEPHTFYGVERNPVEVEIIPTTWWEAGAGAGGELGAGLSYDVVLHSGLKVPTAGGSAFRPRSGRTKIAEAEDQDAAVTGRLRYSGVPGLELAVSGQYQADVTGTADAADIDATLFEAHADWKHSSGLGLRALYARWDYGDDGVIDPGLVDADTLDGWYIEPAWRTRLPAGLPPGEVGVFARYARWDARNELAPLAYEEYGQTVVGLNYWPHEMVVLKFDVQWEDADGPVNNEFDGFNLGVGYTF